MLATGRGLGSGDVGFNGALRNRLRAEDCGHETRGREQSKGWLLHG